MKQMKLLFMISDTDNCYEMNDIFLDDLETIEACLNDLITNQRS